MTMTDSKGRECTPVMISTSFGAGFSTWCYGSATDATLITYLFNTYPQELDTYYCDSSEHEFDCYKFENRPLFPKEMNGFLDDDITVVLIPKGTAYRINEYDGQESIEIYCPEGYSIA